MSRQKKHAIARTTDMNLWKMISLESEFFQWPDDWNQLVLEGPMKVLMVLEQLKSY